VTTVADSDPTFPFFVADSNPIRQRFNSWKYFKKERKKDRLFSQHSIFITSHFIGFV
jgi:hypothetical protein